MARLPSGAIAPALVLLSLASAACASESEERDKRGDWLFSPTPRDAMRELSTDRPDKTESPYTVDAGHFQGEMDVVKWTHDRAGSVRRDDLSFATANLKLGITDRSDLQVVVETWNVSHEHDSASGEGDLESGFGDVTLRWKANLCGDDGGPFALGLMPYVKLPTSAHGNGRVEGGLIIPASVALPLAIDLGLMAEVDVVRDDEERDYRADLVQSITLGHDIAGDLGGYVELWSLVPAGRAHGWQLTVDFGLGYGVTEDIQLDAGVNVGLTSAADDVEPFVGVTVRY